VTFSGGNAGIALAYIGKSMGMSCHIFLPSFVSPRILERMKGLGAQIQVVETGREASDKAIKLAKDNSDISFLHPYDDEDLWEGYSTIVDEIKSQLTGKVPSCIVLSVGGGGMLMGVTTGFKKHGGSCHTPNLLITLY
jgi:L-serine/L-threonine ammonia-lyase